MTTSATSITTTTVAWPMMLETPQILRESDVLVRATLTSKSLRTLTAATREISMADSALQPCRISITELATDLEKIRNLITATANTDTATVVTELKYGVHEIFHTRRARTAVPSKAVVLAVIMVAMVAIKTIAATSAMDLTMHLVAMVHTMLPVGIVLTMLPFVMVLTLALEATLLLKALVATLLPKTIVVTLLPMVLVFVATGLQDLMEATKVEATDGDRVVN